MNYEHNELCNLANLLKDSFSRRKTLKTGRTYKPHPRFSNSELWFEIAKNCKTLDAHPEDFLDAAFKNATMENAPFPNQLKGEAMCSWYKDHAKALINRKEDNQSVLESRLDLEIKAAVSTCLRKQKRQKVDPVSTLLNPVMNIPPYVRIILTSNSLEAMIRYGEETKKYMQISPGWKRVFDKRGLNVELMYECIERKFKRRNK